MSEKNPIPFLRYVALAEAVSYLVLLFVAMPLKYLADLSLAVKWVGWAHGLLFLIFCWALLQAWIAARWSFGRVVLLFVAALLPFVPFFLDKRLRVWEKELRGSEAA